VTAIPNAWPEPSGNLLKRFPMDPKSKTQPVDNTMTGFYEAQFGMRPDNDPVGAHSANAYFTMSPDKGHTAAIAAFSECVATGVAYAPGVVDGARATVVTLKAYESIRTKRPVPIERSEYGL
jgi:hypothetical protein